MSVIPFRRLLTALSTRSAKARAKKMRGQARNRHRTRKLLGMQPLEGRALMATFTVDLVTDENDGNFSPGDLSLREAVAQANANGAGEDTIQFTPSLPNMTLTLGQLPITSAIVMNVGNKGILAGANSRHFDIAPGASLGLNNAVIAFGNFAGQGGSIFNRGTLTIDSGIFQDNTGTEGGAIFNGPGGVLNVDRTTFLSSTASSGSAGAIGVYSGSTATITNSTFSNNRAALFGGAIDVNGSTLVVKNSTLSNNRARHNGGALGQGGGISNFGTTTLHNTLIVGNFVNTGSTLEDVTGFNLQAASTNNLIGTVAAAGGLVHGTNGNIVGNDHDNNSATARIDYLANQVVQPFSHSVLSFPLIDNSPATDKGNNAQAAGTTDRRYASRIQNATDPDLVNIVDIGSFEVPRGMTMNSFVTPDLNTVTYTYNITHPQQPHKIYVFGSKDKVDNGSGESYFFDFTISDPNDLTVGSHTKTFAIGASMPLPGANDLSELGTDYYLMAGTQPFGVQNLVYSGVYQRGDDLMVQGRDIADNVTMVNDGQINFNGTVINTTATNVRAMLHDGNDDFNGSAASIPFRLHGGAGGDGLTGGSANDTIEGGANEDTLQGLGGADIIAGGLGVDALSGQLGDDRYVFEAAGPGEQDFLSDEAGGIDTFDFSALTVPLNITLATGFAAEMGGETANRVMNGAGATIENAIGGSGNDTITGNGVDNTLNGNGGNDSLIGLGGNDTLFGGTGTNTLSGGLGDDLYPLDASSTAVNTLVELAAEGIDTISFAGTSTGATLSLALTTAQLNGALSTTLNLNNTFENLIGSNGNDTLTGNTVANSLTGNAGNDTLIGGAGNDTYWFDADSQLGTDTLNEAGGGTDTLDFSQTTTQAINLDLSIATVQVVNPNLSLILGSATAIENVSAGALGGTLTGNTAANRFVSGPGDDNFVGGAGNDTYVFDVDSPQGVDTINDSAGIDTLDYSPTDFVDLSLNLGLSSLQVNVNHNLTLATGNSIENLNGGQANDLLVGNSLNNTIAGGAGNDFYLFDASIASGSDILNETSGNDGVQFDGNVGVAVNLALTSVQVANPNLSIKFNSATGFENLIGTAGNDTLTGNTLGNFLMGNGGNDVLSGSSGNDTYFFQADAPLGNDSITDSSGIDIIDFGFTSVGTTLALGLTTPQTVNPFLQLTLASATSIENISGGMGDDFYSGNNLGNQLFGNDGNDTLISGAGNDQLTGGIGDDTYGFDADANLGSDLLFEFPGQGADTLDFSATAAGITVDLALATVQTVVPTRLNITLNAGDTFENVLDGSGSDTIRGNSLPNRIRVGAGGGIFNGRDGNDTYVFPANTGGGAFGEGNGVDTIDASAMVSGLTIDLNVIPLIENIIGGSGNDTFTGSSVANWIRGGGGNDLILGMGGNDTLEGGAGDDSVDGGTGNDTMQGDDGVDTLIGGVDNDNDFYLFNTDSQLGTDTIVDAQTVGFATLNFSDSTTPVAVNLGAVGNQVVNGNLSLNLDGLTTPRILIGGQAGDTLTGSNFDDQIQGGSGNDTISGGDGNDLLAGEMDNDTILGGNGNDQLAGGPGNDTLTGGANDDTYAFNVNDGTDTLNETGGGIDSLNFESVSVPVTVNLALATSQSVMTGTSLILGSATTFENVIGGTGNDTITGNTLANRLSGGTGGNDSLLGAAGNDTYALNSSAGSDTINDASGIDTLDFLGMTNFVTLDMALTTAQTVAPSSTLTLTSGAALENATAGIFGSAIFGNALANRLTATNGTHFFDGRNGDDTYAFFIDQGASGSITESGTGVDTLDLSSMVTGFAFSLATFPLVENILGGSGNDNFFGNDLNNLMVGGGGNDTLVGGLGNDTLQGGDGNDILEGQEGTDALQGGLNDDTYIVDADVTFGADTFTELANAGTDTVDFSRTSAGVTFSLVSTAIQTIAANGSVKLNLGTTFENVNGGSGNDTLTGNTLANRMTGNAGNDTLVGSTGNDTYVYDADSPQGTDTITETTTGGVDRIDLSATTTVGANVNLGLATVQVVNPNLSLILGAFIEEVSGTQMDDNLKGNAGNNVLLGNGGSDTLEGLAGNDTLDGGLGVNFYLFDADSALGTDTVIDGDAAQLDFRPTTTLGVNVNASLTTSQIVNANLSLVLNTQDNVTFYGTPLNDQFTGNSGGNAFVGGAGNDILIGNGGNDVYIFNVDTPQGTDTIDNNAAGNVGELRFEGSTLGVNVNLGTTGVVQTLNANLSLNIVAGSLFAQVYGTNMDDVIIGDAGNNVLVGRGGNDTLNGGAGRDILVGGAGTDTLFGGNEDDILIGSLLSHASEASSMRLLMEEWSRTDLGYTARVSNLRNGTGLNQTFRIDSASSTDDSGAVDTLFGEDGVDWFWIYGGDEIGDREIAN